MDDMFMASSINQQLVLAIKSNDVVKVEKLILLGADVNYSDIYVGSALTYAIHQQNIKILALLIRHGVDVNKVNIFNITPIETAVRTANVEMINLLIHHGAILKKGVSYFYQQRIKQYLKPLSKYPQGL